MEVLKNILADIKKGQISPIYLLTGEEAYYIDAFSDYIENNLLPEHERDFNQTILYGREVTVDDIVAQAKRFPMMADRQVIIVKEAQELAKTIDLLEPYVKNPQPTTVLVICYKYKKLDKRKSLYKTILNKGVVFESAQIYENKIPEWIKSVLAGRKYTITPKASQMLVEFLGNDLGKIDGELKKLQIILPEGTQITPEHIEQNIGISKDFNVFELRKAIGNRDSLKAFRIVKYFADNPKQNPIVALMPQIMGFFVQLLQYHGLSDKSPRAAAAALKVNPYFIGEYATAAKNFPMKKVSKAIEVVRDIDLKSKGVHAHAIPPGDLYKELLVRIFN